MIILNEVPYIYYLLKRLYSGNEKGKKKLSRYAIMITFLKNMINILKYSHL